MRGAANERTAPAPIPCASDDLKQIREAQNGSLTAFEVLVEKHHARIYNFIWQFVRNQHDAEDLTQDTFVKAYRAISRFDAKYSFTAWLFTIARRTAINHYQRAKITEELSSDLTTGTTDPADSAAAKDHAESIWKVAERLLKPKQYEALWLTYGEGFSNVETAQIMRNNPIYVKVLLHRAREVLKQKFIKSEVL
jgi:RNA polymerase sigma-70 factor (ECF subfamily)